MITRIVSAGILMFIAAGCGNGEQSPPKDPSSSGLHSDTSLTSASMTRTTPVAPANAPPEDPEQRITSSLTRRIGNDWALSSSAPTVSVLTEGSKVILRGTVRSDYERTTVELLAWQTPGVEVVENRLAIAK